MDRGYWGTAAVTAVLAIAAATLAGATLYNVSPENLMLDVLDKELERRGHRFARYADDGAPGRREEEALM